MVSISVRRLRLGGRRLPVSRKRYQKKPPAFWPAVGCSRLSLAVAEAVEEALQLPAADGMLQLADCLPLDLPHPFARHLEDTAYLFERVGVTIPEAVAELDDLALAVGQRLEDVVDLVLEHLLGRGADGRFSPVVLDEVAEVAVLAFADRP